MNMNRLINMGIRMLMNFGADKLANGGKDPSEMTREERQAAQKNKQNIGKARKGMNIMRRFMR